MSHQRLTRRTQILLDEDRYRRLERHASSSGASIAALIRDAIDRAYPAVPPDRARAAAEFLREARRNPVEVDDWPVMKREINAIWEQHPDTRGLADE